MMSLVVVGGGGHSRACIDVIETTGQYRIVGIVDRVSVTTSPTDDYPLIGTDEELPALIANHHAAHIAVGQIKTSAPRERLFAALRAAGAAMPVIVSPHAYVSRRTKVGDGTIVMHGAVVNAGAVIGENCIINSLALVEHDAEVGAHTHLSTGSRINGAVRVGTGTFVGSGAVIREGVRIGDGCVVGAGALVLHDVPDGTTVRGER